MSTAVGTEGGFAPNLASNADALACIKEAVEKAGYVLGKDVTLAMDCASSGFSNRGKWYVRKWKVKVDDSLLKSSLIT